MSGDDWIEGLQADNDNVGVIASWETPAEVFQKIAQIKCWMKERMVADFTKRADPDFRQKWETLLEIEKCAHWQLRRHRLD